MANQFHTPECLAILAAYEAAQQEYERQWPNYCRSCYGTGDIYGAEDDEGDFCENCIYADKCPRCNTDFHYVNGYSRCANCGWETGNELECPIPVMCDCSEKSLIGFGEEALRCN